MRLSTNLTGVFVLYNITLPNVQNEDPFKIVLKALPKGSHMILDRSRNKEHRDLQLSTNLTGVFVLYITLPNAQNEDPFKIVLKSLPKGLEGVFEKYTVFDSTKRHKASCLVEMFNPRDGPVGRNIPLAVSQSTSVEQHDQLVADGAIPMSNEIPSDATNSCSFLPVLIAKRILEERRDDDLPSLNVALEE